MPKKKRGKPAQYRRGDKVFIDGLVSAKKYNGRLASVVGPSLSEGRIKCELVHGEEVDVRPANVRLATMADRLRERNHMLFLGMQCVPEPRKIQWLSCPELWFGASVDGVVEIPDVGRWVASIHAHSDDVHNGTVLSISASPPVASRRAAERNRMAAEESLYELAYHYSTMNEEGQASMLVPLPPLPAETEGGGGSDDGAVAGATLTEQWSSTLGPGMPRFSSFPELLKASREGPERLAWARSEFMARLGIDDEFLAGLLPVGDWTLVTARMNAQATRVRAAVESTCANPSCTAKPLLKCSRCKLVAYCGKKCQTDDWRRHRKQCRPLQVGDRILVLGGNNVKQSSIGRHGILECYFADEGKWGLVLDNGCPVRISKKNLKRVQTEH